MNVTCHTCKTKFNIPDHKIPRGKGVTVKCPKCEERIKLPPLTQETHADRKQGQSARIPFEERRNALVLIDDDELNKKVYSIIEQMGFEAETAINTKAAVTKMEYHVYHLVVIDDTFDQDKGLSVIIKKMNAMDMSLRRKICLVWISNKYNTNDGMAALHSSVNSIIHIDDVIHLEAVLSKCLKEHKNFYTVYNNSLKQMGRV